MCFVFWGEELNLSMKEAGDRILNVLSICLCSLILFLKGEHIQECFGSISVHLIQLFLGYFIFTDYKLSHWQRLIIS